MMPQTECEVEQHLPRVMAQLTVQYVRSQQRDEHSIGLAGEGEHANSGEPYVNGVATGGHLALVKRVATDMDHLLKVGCRYGHMHILHFALAQKREFAAVNWGLACACRGGHLQAATLMIAHGARSFDEALYLACRSGHLRLANLLIEYGATNFNEALDPACFNGHLAVVKRLAECGATKFDTGLAMACRNGHADTALFLLSAGATNLNWALQLACRQGYRKLARLLESKGGKCNCNLTHH
jgi:hypothetical protein